MSITYYAKSADEDGHQETNHDHLEKVANLAQIFGAEINMPSEAYMCGIMHDFGKYGQRFQNVLNKTESSIDHAICGAVYLSVKIVPRRSAYRLVAVIVAAHHSGLRSFEDLKQEMTDIFKGNGSCISGNGKKASLIGQTDYETAESVLLSEFPSFAFKKLNKYGDDSPTAKMLRARMLLSCLVDADYTVSSGKIEESDTVLEPDLLLQKLYLHMDKLRKASKSNRELNRLRDDVFRQCGDAGNMEPGIFTLTAPTGVGKTMSLLHFALKHCAVHGKRRIILVLPFLTLTEQSQREYEKLIPDILADHSQSRLSEEQRELAARWDSPFIITTSVRFFESLFAYRPKDCRKLHSIAQSVIIFDEAQSLPKELAAATMKSISSLCKDYGCTMVFSTATQPDFGALPELEDWQPREILPDGEKLYAALRRTQLHWKIDTPTSLEDIAGEMARSDSVCAIVNLRRHAAKLFESLKTLCLHDSLFFLTTDLCPGHRSNVIDEIKARLRDGKPCRVVATQCIEAGVDLDFKTVYRALAPLEAIIQAAGRCNRNGLGTGHVTVFIPEDGGNIYPGESYWKAAEIVKIMHASGNVDIHDPKTIKDYYRRLFCDAESKGELTKAIKGENYEEAAAEYKLISKQGVQVIVPYDESLFMEVYEQAMTDGLTPELIRKAAPITVSSYNEDLVRQHCEQIPWHRKRAGDICESDFYILALGHWDLYTSDMGLKLSAPDPKDDIFMV